MVYEYWVGGDGTGDSDPFGIVYEAASSGSTAALVFRAFSSKGLDSTHA